MKYYYTKGIIIIFSWLFLLPLAFLSYAFKIHSEIAIENAKTVIIVHFVLSALFIGLAFAIEYYKSLPDRLQDDLLDDHLTR